MMKRNSANPYRGLIVDKKESQIDKMFLHSKS